MTEDLQVALVIETAHSPVRSSQRPNVIDLQAQFVAGVGAAGERVAADLRGLEGTTLAPPSGATAGCPAREEPHVVALELAGVPVGTISGTSRR